MKPRLFTVPVTLTFIKKSFSCHGYSLNHLHIHHITQIWTSWCNYKSMNELHQFIILIISHYVVFIYIHVISFVILYSIFFFVNKSVYLINSSFSLANCAFKKIKYSLQFVSKHCIVKYIGQKCQTFVRATKWICGTSM